MMQSCGRGARGDADVNGADADRACIFEDLAEVGIVLGGHLCVMNTRDSVYLSLREARGG